MRGTMADSHAHLHEALDAFNRRHFDGHIQSGVIAAKKFDHAAAKRRFHAVGNEAFVFEIGHIHFFAFGERMFRRHHQSEFILQDFRGLQLRFARHKRNRPQIQPVIHHFVRNIAGKHAVNTNLYARMKLSELPERRQQCMN